MSADRPLATLAAEVTALSELSDLPRDRRRTLGFEYTLAEIQQQPETWASTARTLESERERVRPLIEAVVGAGPSATVLLTGSGSSSHLGTCLAPGLQTATGVTVRSVPSGDLLTHPGAFLPSEAPCLVVSFGRSGNSPESAAVVERLTAFPHVRQLLVTCNAEGRLAAEGRRWPGVECVLLDERTNDRSLVMTSSFTNLLLAGWLLLGDRPDRLEHVDRLASAGARILARAPMALRDVVRRTRRILYLGTGTSVGAGVESALKMIEMTAGAVATLVESFLSVRHGPMAAIDPGALVVLFLSDDSVPRAYEADLVEELERKALGGRRVLVGRHVEPSCVRPGDLAVVWDDVPPPTGDLTCVLHVLVGQWLAFWRCALEGLRPDAPSRADVITRVVAPFRLHPPPGRS